MTPDERQILGEIKATVDDMHVDVKRICPMVDKHEESIKNIRTSVTWLKRIMLSAVGIPVVGIIIAKLLGGTHG